MNTSTPILATQLSEGVPHVADATIDKLALPESLVLTQLSNADGPALVTAIDELMPLKTIDELSLPGAPATETLETSQAFPQPSPLPSTPATAVNVYLTAASSTQLFCNDTRGGAYAESEGWETIELEFIGTRLSLIPNARGFKCTVVITQSCQPTIVASNRQVTFKSV